MDPGEFEQVDMGSDSDSDGGMELVGFPQHNGTTNNNNNRNVSRRRKARQDIHNTGSGDYQEVVNDTFQDEEEYVSEEDGLISQISASEADHDAGSSVGYSTNLDDVFYYGFSNAEAAIDWRCAFWLVLSLVLLAFLALVLPRINNFGKPRMEEEDTGDVILIFPNGTKTNIGPRNRSSHFVKYECPVPDNSEGAENYHNSSVEQSYINQTSQIESNFSNFLQNFHESEFDGWGKTYNFVKQGMYHWKSTRFPKHLKDGDTIYESACGIGLNLIMTLEILQEVKGVNNLIVYGNEYLASSVNTSHKLLDALLPQLNTTKGSICAADSTNLNFIPANSFDLVFTGYVSTLLDPLDLEKGIKENYEYYEKICKGESWEDKKLKEVAQQRQNDWFGVWVGEMIRIAKPGAPVIVEQVSYPFCDAIFDWGGVNQDYWTDFAIEKYDWKVDPTSIEFEDDRIFRKRYHVFMRKQTLNMTKATVAPIDGNGGGKDLRHRRR